ncbi:putative cyclic di-GMP phosphodiesterase PdeC [Cupriavidus laharis]|uniref:Cyclic di-GMP phosphodiesterase PdeC n=2 Tax=Cupriavidus laharis TaxID=151654 RepID=A0ABM8XVZ6_9BURK|nr:putative cyclic di-GMP phosphodiesterase PdeC [Cupriavidus laharis]
MPVAVHAIAMAYEPGFEVVADGIEHEEQARYVRKRGAQYAQGWLPSRALPAPGQVHVLREWQPVPDAA